MTRKAAIELQLMRALAPSTDNQVFFHNIKEMSTSGLRSLQRSIHDRLVEEDAGTTQIYGVRQHTDWHKQSDEIEAELNSRGEIYTKVPW